VTLAVPMRTARQPWESGWATARRRRTAAEAVVRIAKLSSAARLAAQQTASRKPR
jgi:hypothetical protein